MKKSLHWLTDHSYISQRAEQGPAPRALMLALCVHPRGGQLSAYCYSCSGQAPLPADWLESSPRFPWHPQAAARRPSPRMPPRGVIADILP